GRVPVALARGPGRGPNGGSRRLSAGAFGKDADQRSAQGRIAKRIAPFCDLSGAIRSVIAPDVLLSPREQRRSRRRAMLARVLLNSRPGCGDLRGRVEPPLAKGIRRWVAR